MPDKKPNLLMQDLWDSNDGRAAVGKKWKARLDRLGPEGFLA
jgi:hypothetical protein